MWAIQATISRTGETWTATRQVPTFYLDERVQGIVSKDHAAQIARDIVNPYADKSMWVEVTAVKLNDEDAYCPECLELYSDTELGCDACATMTDNN